MPVELAPGVFWVGAVDWTLRDFHGYLTEDGTTYNAFLIVDDHNTLIDTVKVEFVPELLARVAEIVDPEKISYLVSNHVEMDHSGGLPEVVARVKPEKIFCSPKGREGLSRHYQADWPFQEVKTGSEVSLGRYTLSFLETPMLHWPDSMMTYLKEEQLLFSSDAFGAHLASGERFDDHLPRHPSDYLHQVKKYYANILMPFGSLITQLFDKIAQLGLRFQTIAPDHGLIYRQDPGRVLEAYRKWARMEPERKALVIYDTMWHSTELLAEAFTQGLVDAGVDAQLHHLRRTHYSDIVTEVLDAGLLLFGSPTLNNGLFPTMGEFLTYLKGLKPKNKAAMAFGSYGWSGQAVGLINQEIQAMKLPLAHEGFRVTYIPTPEELAAARKLGEQLAREHLPGS
jgi:flavorubredoxin